MTVQSPVIFIKERNQEAEREELAAMSVPRELQVESQRFGFGVAGGAMSQQKFEPRLFQATRAAFSRIGPVLREEMLGMEIRDAGH